MGLEPIKVSEVSQKEKEKYCILTHTHIYIYIYKIQKDGTHEPTYRAAKETQT